MSFFYLQIIETKNYKNIMFKNTHSVIQTQIQHIIFFKTNII